MMFTLFNLTRKIVKLLLVETLMEEVLREFNNYMVCIETFPAHFTNVLHWTNISFSVCMV